MTQKNLKRSFLLILADLLLGAGELLRDHFGYGVKKDTEVPPPPPEPPPNTSVSSFSAQEPPVPDPYTPDTVPAKTVQEPPVQEQPAAPLDEKGVTFSAEYCGKAKDPYYGSGPRKGQWKKRKGVQDLQYDNWYSSQLAPADPPAEVATQQFGAQPPSNETPKSLGGLMKWIAEQQAAGKVTPELVNQAYIDTKVTFVDVNNPDTAEGAIEVLYLYIKTRIQ